MLNPTLVVVPQALCHTPIQWVNEKVEIGDRNRAICNLQELHVCGNMHILTSLKVCLQQCTTLTAGSSVLIAFTIAFSLSVTSGHFSFAKVVNLSTHAFRSSWYVAANFLSWMRNMARMHGRALFEHNVVENS